MTRSGISRKISSKFQLSVEDAERVLDTIIESMFSALKSGSRVEIRGFGSFYVRKCEPYKGRDPRTGKDVEVKAKNLPCFRQGKEIRDFFNKMSARDR